MERQERGQLAKVSWNVEAGRHELRIMGKLKAHTDGITAADHDAAKPELVLLASLKGYTVIQDDKQHGNDYNKEYPPL